MLAIPVSLLVLAVVGLAVGAGFGEGEEEDEKVPTSQERDDGTFGNGAMHLERVEPDPEYKNGILPEDPGGVENTRIGPERYRCEYNSTTEQYDAVEAPVDFRAQQLKVTDDSNDCSVSPQSGMGGAGYEK